MKAPLVGQEQFLARNEPKCLKPLVTENITPNNNISLSKNTVEIKTEEIGPTNVVAEAETAVVVKEEIAIKTEPPEVIGCDEVGRAEASAVIGSDHDADEEKSGGEDSEIIKKGKRKKLLKKRRLLSASGSTFKLK